MDIIVGMNREELIGLQAILSEEVASTRGWTGIRDLWCIGESIHLGAIYAGEVVGAAAVCHFGDGFCEIHKLYVAPTFRRTDIARRLVEKVEDMSRERGWEEIGFEISGGSRPFWTRYLGERLVETLGEGKFVFRVGGWPQCDHTDD